MRALEDALPPEALGDAAEAPGLAASVDALIRPGNPAEVSEALAWARGEGTTIVPVGTGRHVPRVVAPVRCAVLSTERMSGVTIYEPADLTLTALAGTPLSALRDELAPHAQWLPFDPPDVEARTLGGLVASGLSGPLATGYGALRNHVLGATVVLGDGRRLRLGGRVVKNVAGFDLLRPVVGSLGGLCVVTEICVRLFPEPKVDRLLISRADTPSALVGAARAVARAPVIPASCVLVSGADGSGGGAALLVRLHGARRTVDADQRTFERAIGRPVEVVDEEVAVVARAARDHPVRSGGDAGAAGGTVAGAGQELGIGVASAPADRLGNLLSALDSALGRVPFSCDAYSGRVRFGLDAGRVPALATLRRAVEALGGSLGVERAPGGGAPDLGDAVSTPSAGEAKLAARVRAVFDPTGIFWPSADQPAIAGDAARPGAIR
ncbi:MAG: FAD-binding oxidoreductase [Gemmatimonadota bacterium]